MTDKVRYKPVPVTAMKIGEIGTGQNKQDILKLEMNRDDADSLRDSELDGERNGERNTRTQTQNVKEDDMVDEAQIEKIVSSMMAKSQLHETVNNINDVSSRTEKSLTAMNEQFQEQFNELKSKQDELKTKQEESCTDIGCVKKDVEQIKSNSLPKLDKIHDELANHEFATCSGKKGCNANIPVGSSFCPNCGLKIKKWPNHPEWIPYWDRAAVKA
jgi:hypothetical protein